MQALLVPPCPITVILHQHEIPCKTTLIRDLQTIWSPFRPYEQTETTLWMMTLVYITLQGDQQFSDMFPE
jgi:hypothetical protein